ncbi:hypothetical protein [Paraburkholderia phytofirmans]|uniref:Uncharacterized protein n=1 Tax=Paraburkholderia phytofirmans TaxID=261302 RepID=A0ABW9BL79_9BURK
MSFVDAGAKRIGVRPKWVSHLPDIGSRTRVLKAKSGISLQGLHAMTEESGNFPQMNIFERVMKTLHRARRWSSRLKQPAVPRRSRQLAVARHGADKAVLETADIRASSRSASRSALDVDVV